MKAKIAIAMLLCIVLLSVALPAFSAPDLSGGEPPFNEVRIRVDVTSVGGHVLQAWRDFINRNYPDWIIASTPYQVGGRWFVGLIKYVRVPAILIIPSIPDLCSPHRHSICPPDRRPA